MGQPVSPPSERPSLPQSLIGRAVTDLQPNTSSLPSQHDNPPARRPTDFTLVTGAGFGGREHNCSQKARSCHQPSNLWHVPSSEWSVKSASHSRTWQCASWPHHRGLLPHGAPGRPGQLAITTHCCGQPASYNLCYLQVF